MGSNLHRIVWAFLLVPLLLATGMTGAAEFYSAQTPVAAGDEATQRQKGLAAALHVVVGQVTGNPEVADSVVLQPEYLSAARYVKEYHFVEAAGGRRLDVRFEPVAVDAMLRRYGLRPWTERPAVVVWLAGSGGSGPRFLSPETETRLWRAAQDAATRQGLDMVQPLLDLEDRAALPASDVSARVASPVRDASIRYDADAVLSAYLAASDAAWQADWMLLSGELTRRWTTRGTDAAEALSAGVNDAASILDTLIPRPGTPALDLSIPPSHPVQPVSGEQDADDPTTSASVGAVSVPAGRIVARVSGIVGPGDYNRAMVALRENVAVERASVIAVEPEAIIVAVTPVAEGSGLSDALEANGVLQGEPSGSALSTTSGITLFFRLTPANP